MVVSFFTANSEKWLLFSTEENESSLDGEEEKVWCVMDKF